MPPGKVIRTVEAVVEGGAPGIWDICAHVPQAAPVERNVAG